MAQVQINEKQYEILKSLILKEGNEDGLNPNAERCLMTLKDALDRFYTGLKLGYFDNPEDDIDVSTENVFWSVWNEYLKHAYAELSKQIYSSKLYQSGHGENI